MFIFSLTYVKPLEEVEKYLDEHNVFLEKFYATGNFIFSGRKHPRTGGIILCKAKDLKEAKEIYSQDPFYIKAIATYDVIEFFPTKTIDAIKDIIN